MKRLVLILLNEELRMRHVDDPPMRSRIVKQTHRGITDKLNKAYNRETSNRIEVWNNNYTNKNKPTELWKQKRYFSVVCRGSCCLQPPAPTMISTAETKPPQRWASTTRASLSKARPKRQKSSSRQISGGRPTSNTTGGGEEWLTITPSEGFGNIEITVSTERNCDLTKTKTARLVIESDDDRSSFRKEFDVKQNPSEPYIELSGLEENRLATSVTRSETELTLYTNDSWEAETADKAWCSVVSDGTEKGKQTVKLVCELNATHVERSTRVTFRSKSDASVSYAFDVIQSGTFNAPESHCRRITRDRYSFPGMPSWAQ